MIHKGFFFFFFPKSQRIQWRRQSILLFLPPWISHWGSRLWNLFLCFWKCQAGLTHIFLFFFFLGVEGGDMIFNIFWRPFFLWAWRDETTRFLEVVHRGDSPLQVWPEGPWAHGWAQPMQGGTLSIWREGDDGPASLHPLNPQIPQEQLPQLRS